MYLNGLGTAKDVGEAIRLYERVAKLEFFAAIELARIYARGTAGQVDPKKALEWYSVAASFEGPEFDYDAVGAEFNEAKAYVEDHTDGPGDSV